MTSHTSRSRILLGVGGMTLIFPMLSMAEGFVDDTKATLTLRNAYFNRNFTNPAFWYDPRRLDTTFGGIMGRYTEQAKLAA
ncbi:hypothetical protein RYA99_25720, partial [Pseudomonas syringae pv. actinidifoliorum]|nr:hypothetical protein [Pseudomonas syringae pv. actinidifoliorum]MDU8523335.1 hypothetical protein [Pseudomonas syringae pv. actinidifoliorum]MDU8529553.1 hypothetical protein [Pseudomonas syringae pv. actinidifoliorum]